MYGDTPRNGGTPLAHREDFRLGDATVRPSLCIVAGPQGSVTVEPRVMEVLVTLADARGAVLSRDDLMQACWRGAIVSEDAINRTIREIRRAARETGAGFGIMTISRVGYRLTELEGAGVPVTNEGNGGGSEAAAGLPPPGQAPQAPPSATRRWLLGAGVATAAAATALVLYLRDPRKPPPDPRVRELMEAGREKLRWEHVVLPGTGLEAVEGVKELREAVALASDNAEAWGWLALACAYAAENDINDAYNQCLAAVRRARDLGRDPNADVAEARVRRGEDSWALTEAKLRAVVKAFPDNIAARTALAQSLQSAGRTRESIEESRIIRKLDQDAAESWPGSDFRWAIQMWIVGERDQAVEAANLVTSRHNFDHPAAWRNALFVLAMTGEYQNARTLLDAAMKARKSTPAFDQQWRLALQALEFRHEVARAQEFVALGVPLPAQMGFVHRNTILWELGQADTAWAEFNSYFRNRVDPELIIPVAPGMASDHNPRWRQFQWVFTPGMRNLHCHPGFTRWTREFGLADYWQERGGPDPQHICKH